MSELSVRLATFRDAGYVKAPAGFGKTHLIALATSHSVGRQLILTHTYAGVNALRRKMRELQVAGKCYHVDTIASWSLRLLLSYSSTSGWNIERPASDHEWNQLYETCYQLLDEAFIRRILRASYAGVFVDEYQDCSVSQHKIVLRLARDLPCRVLGDPLQSIFDFNGQETVSWAPDVESTFELLGELNVPHRWKRVGAPALGDWLWSARRCLEQGHAIDLRAAPEPAVRLRLVNNPEQFVRSQLTACRDVNCAPSETVVAIHKGSQEYKARCHRLARSLSGQYSSIEEIEGRDLFAFVRKIEAEATGGGRLREVIAFAKKCMTGINNKLPAPTQRGQHTPIRRNTRNPKIVERANEYLQAPGSTRMTAFLTALQAAEGVHVVRADLFNRTLGVLRKHILNPDLSLSEAAEKYHSEFRYKGRPVGRRRIIGTTLLVKGLEFDHAIVLDAGSLSRKELYVALTRGARSLTIVSGSEILNPQS